MLARPIFFAPALICALLLARNSLGNEIPKRRSRGEESNFLDEAPRNSVLTIKLIDPSSAAPTADVSRLPGTEEPSRDSSVDTKQQRDEGETQPGNSATNDVLSPMKASTPAATTQASETVPTYPNVKISGVFQADAGFFSQDDASRAAFGQIQDGADFRRARLAASGAVTSHVNYFLQMDFAAFGRPTFTDVWVEQTDLPWLGTVRVGQWKQPFSLEVASTFRYTTFLERSLLFVPFTPFRHIGAGFQNHSEDLTHTWALSGFRTGQDQFGGSISTDGGWGTSERFTWCPWWDEATDGRGYLHLGLGHFYSNPPNDTHNFRTIPEFFLGEQAPGVVGTSGVAAPGAVDGTPFFVQTGPLAMRHGYNVLGSEFLLVNGPISLQSEAMVAMGELKSGETFAFPGFYTQIGYFLTGEHRPYDRKTATIDRVQPFANFTRHCQNGCLHSGPGAWEVACRVSYINLNDGSIRGGELTDVTAGLNWYLNPNTKIAFNWIHAFDKNPTVGPNDTDIFAVRAQVDF